MGYIVTGGESVTEAIRGTHSVVLIPAGAVGMTITGLGLDEVPTTVLAQIVNPTTGKQIVGAVVLQDTITADGFVCDFGAVIPEAGYQLHYVMMYPET